MKNNKMQKYILLCIYDIFNFFINTIYNYFYYLFFDHDHNERK